MNKVFISQPMKGLTDDEILKTRNEVKLYLERVAGRPIEIISSFIEGEPVNIKNDFIAVWYLGKSIQSLSQADMVYFCDGWDKARGCKIEHEIAKQYGLKIIKE